MTTDLRALVLGTGFAGEGHAKALQYCGVHVVGIVGRTKARVETVAQELGIPHASISWEQTLDDLRPDVVAIATPGGAHFEPVMQALDRNIHVFCDKPLAETAEKAHQMYERAQAVGGKTAYAASYRYQPNVRYAQELIRQGKIGQVLEIECISHFNLDKLIPFGWSHRIEQGGGRLNNNFTHKLSIVEYLTQGSVHQITGTTRNDMKKAPIVTGIHDFRKRREFIPKEDELDQLEWAEVNAEWSYTVLAELESPHASQHISVLFKHSGLQPRYSEDHIAIYGDSGTIVMTGCYGQGDFKLYQEEKGWHQQDIPPHILAELPSIADNTQRNWTMLIREFVADVRGEQHQEYQTFMDGWRYQRIVEAIRENNIPFWHN